MKQAFTFTTDIAKKNYFSFCNMLTFNKGLIKYFCWIWFYLLEIPYQVFVSGVHGMLCGTVRSGKGTVPASRYPGDPLHDTKRGEFIYSEYWMTVSSQQLKCCSASLVHHMWGQHVHLLVCVTWINITISLTVRQGSYLVGPKQSTLILLL